MSENTRPTPETRSVAKEIGRLSSRYKVGEINAGQFGSLAQAELDKLAEIERQRDEARENNGRNAAMLARTLIERDAARRQRDRLLRQRDRLLKALEKMLHLCEHDLGMDGESPYIEQARAAIAEVEGGR